MIFRNGSGTSIHIVSEGIYEGLDWVYKNHAITKRKNELQAKRTFMKWRISEDPIERVWKKTKKCH